ncbi:MAG: Ig-like domain-containing protein, partial [Actinomycetota bacterium]
ETLVYEEGGSLFKTTVNPATMTYTPPIEFYTPVGTNHEAENPSCTQDGRIVFDQNFDGGYPQLAIVNLDGSSLRVLTSNATGESYAYGPAASRTPGNRRIAYDMFSYCDRFGTCTGPGIATLDPDDPQNTEQTIVVTAGGSDLVTGWGTDGRITYTHSDGAVSEGRIMSVGSNGGASTQLTMSTTDTEGVSAGSLMAFTRSAGSLGRPIELARLDQKSVGLQTTGTPADERMDLVYLCANGVTEPVAAGLPPDDAAGSSALWTIKFDPTNGCGGGAGTVIPAVSDGFTRVVGDTGFQVTQTVANKEPVAAIAAPAEGQTFSLTGVLPLNGGASDPEKGELSSLTWSLDGTQIATAGQTDVSAPPNGWTPGQHTLTLTASDGDGHTAIDSRTITIVDDVAPTVGLSHTPNGSNGWSVTSPVVVHVTAADIGTGVNLLQCYVDGTQVPVSGPSTGATFNVTRQGVHSTWCDARDGANNYGTGYDTVPLDTAGPAIAISSPAQSARYVRGASVAAGYSCTDSFSGATACNGSVPNGVPIDTSTPGTKTFTVGSIDAAGNSSAKSVTYTVLRDCTQLASADVSYFNGTMLVFGPVYIALQSPTVQATLHVQAAGCSDVRYTLRVLAASSDHSELKTQSKLGDGSSSDLTFSIDMGNGPILGGILDPPQVCIALDAAPPSGGTPYDRLPSTSCVNVRQGHSSTIGH